jgi:hypothetical protein
MKGKSRDEDRQGNLGTRPREARQVKGRGEAKNGMSMAEVRLGETSNGKGARRFKESPDYKRGKARQGKAMAVVIRC